ncbi:hypothetical protein Moror_12947 [Moniliophthora roreri MCA 2997]|uniref:Helitron helicase-like domain-containing protein n=1 Tax=Moniliophthora roreri (strain MCA 2997) TaxID=1381753 RepID=V2YQJ5_MONRO|nr:hypothetical protein Moror_12947 [Moniliophthora roreri MCA 2997]
MHGSVAAAEELCSSDLVDTCILINTLLPFLNIWEARAIACCHGAKSTSHMSMAAITTFFARHECMECNHVTVVWHQISPLCTHEHGHASLAKIFGGGRKKIILFQLFEPYIVPSTYSNTCWDKTHQYTYYMHGTSPSMLEKVTEDMIAVALPPQDVLKYLTLEEARSIAQHHGAWASSKMKMAQLIDFFASHACSTCAHSVSLLKYLPTASSVKLEKQCLRRADQKKKLPIMPQIKEVLSPNMESFLLPSHNLAKATFPPEPLTDDLIDTIVHSACMKLNPSYIKEAGCAVCGQLTQRSALTNIRKVKKLLRVLEVDGVTRKEHLSPTDPIVQEEGPSSLSKGQIPKQALATGLWLGEVPEVLKNLTFVEKMLVAKVRHTSVFVCIATGGRKMKANVMAFESPMPKIYNILPPPREDIEEVLAIMFTGPSAPTPEDLAHTPLLYNEKMPPCCVMWKEAKSNKVSESEAVNDDNDEDGIEDGCAFTVHGITGEQLLNFTKDEITGIACRHFSSGGKVLTIGHNSQGELLWKNPSLYPKMFSWLFPYGHGGLGTTKLNDANHNKWLLMYYDKQFQEDKNFPIVAFSHQQVKAATQSGWLLADKSSFASVAERITSLNESVLQDIASQLEKGETVKPQTPEEVACFKVLGDLDRVAGKVPGAPTWYITISPSDEKHPISLYFAGNDEPFKPLIRGHCEHLFLEDVLGYNAKHRGLYGEHDAHYGVVEQQGHLTLHLHLLLWIKGSLSPEDIRKKLLDGESSFEHKFVEYLKSVFSGDFIDSNHQDVTKTVDEDSKSKDYHDPTETLLQSPLQKCPAHPLGRPHTGCLPCTQHLAWHKHYKHTVNDLILKSNHHRCDWNLKKDGTVKKKHLYKGCRDNQWGKCRARFPRALFSLTTVDRETRGITMKKIEPWFNTFSYSLTYLLRCNTDVTLLESGTAIKSVVLYVTDYIMKVSLKTHVIFDAIVSVFSKNKSIAYGTKHSQDSARHLLTKVVNLLSTKMEFGAPLICSYLLDYPDHYTDYTFIPFYWQQYVSHVHQVCDPDEKPDRPQKVALLK